MSGGEIGYWIEAANAYSERVRERAERKAD
jgi:hypothetical protein